jgi:hypothetical protein
MYRKILLQVLIAFILFMINPLLGVLIVLMPQVQTSTKLVDIKGIRKDLIESTVARQVAPHPILLKGSSETTKWYAQHDKVYLKYVSNFDKVTTRSDFSSEGITLGTPGIQDSLRYGHYELEAIQGDVIPFDARQKRLVEYFTKAENRIFFAGRDPGVGSTKNLAIVDKASKAVIDAAAPGTYASTTATSELDLGTPAEALEDLSAMIGQIRTGLSIASLKQFIGVLVVTVSVKNRLEGLLNANTDSTLQDVIERGLAKAFGSFAVLTTDMLGAALDFKNNEIIATPTGNRAVLMAVSGDAFAEVRTSKLIQRKEEGEVSGLVTIVEEKYVPIFKQPLANVYSDTVVLTA